MEHKHIQVGTRVYCGLYGGKRGIVYAIHGDLKPETIRFFQGGAGVMGGNAKLDIVFDDGSISPMVPEAIVRGVQWRIYDEVADQAEIAFALAKAKTVEMNRQKAEQEEKARFEAEVEALRTNPAYAHLEQGSDQYRGKLAAKNIRKELRRAYPKVKFSVRMTGSGAVDIDWVDGPTKHQVKAIVDKYSGGRYNSMDDIYEHSRSPWTTVFGGAKYIFTQREFSPALIARAIDQVFEKYSGNLSDIPKPTVEDYQSGRLGLVEVPLINERLDALIRITAAEIDCVASPNPAPDIEPDELDGPSL